MPFVIEENVDLQGLNTLAVPVNAQYYARLEEPRDLEPLLNHAYDAGWPVLVLGEGSNVVFGEKLPGLVLHQQCRGIELLEESPSEVLLRVAGGENWHDFVEWCLDRDYFGLENLALIPGTVGAAPIQNIGAYGVEVGGFVEEVRCRWLADATVQLLTESECEFGYRDSVFKHGLRNRVLIESVTFRLPLEPAPRASYTSLALRLARQDISKPTPRQVFEAVVAIRRERLPDPAEIPNAGSFFKNPRLSGEDLRRFVGLFPDAPYFADPRGGYKLAAAWLIEQCGFKQQVDRAVRVHPEHALVIINPERQPASAIQALALEIKIAVQERFDIELVQEPRYYG